MDAVRDEDRAAGQVDQLAGPAEHAEATSDRGVDQHRTSSRFAVGESCVFKVALRPSLVMASPWPYEELAHLLGAGP